MQNRYSGDIGDFSKLGLLRALIPCGLPIGINWYLVPDETHNSDGRHVKYLEKDALRKCDEHLWHELGHIVHDGKRSVQALQAQSILPAIHYSTVLDFSGMGKSEREIKRRKWHEQALNRLSKAAIVCTDPDNGLVVPSAKGTARENKYILPEEVRDYFLQGSSVIYYQHKARKQDSFYLDQHQRLLEDTALKGASGMVLKFATTSQRYYCFVMQPDHAHVIEAAVKQMLNTAWADHFTIL